jgi:hypothetical protein
MRLDGLIVVGEISSSFLLDDEGNNASVVVDRCFICQRSALNYVFAIQTWTRSTIY